MWLVNSLIIAFLTRLEQKKVLGFHFWEQETWAIAQVYRQASISFQSDLQKTRWLDDAMCYVNVSVSEWICGFHVAQPGVCCHGDVSSFLFMSPADDLSQGHINPAGLHLRQRGDESGFMYTSQHAYAHVDKQAHMQTQQSSELFHHDAWGNRL